MSRFRHLITLALAVIAAVLPAHTAAASAADGEDVTYYVVQEKGDGEPEFLFEIAQRYLGDGNRYPEIFELNEGRLQPDGSTVTTPEVLLPGWILVMPEGAEGEGLRTGPLPEVTPAAPEEDPLPYYVVGRTPDGEVEYLYLIAERFLGDGERWPEIFELNEGRAQPDGGALTDPETVEVGWALRLPADARGDDLRSGPPPGPSPSPPGPSASATPVAGDAAAAPGGPLVPALIVLGTLLVAGGLAAGAVLLLRRRRAARPAEPFDDSLLRTDTSSAWMTDRALRVLVAACERDGIEVPALAALFIEGPAMRLRLGNPRDVAPAPWVAGDGGATWTAQIARLQDEPASDARPAQFSRLVALGVAESGRVMIDFAQARGIVSIEGSARARHEVLRRWLGELTTNPWSGNPRVVMVGNGLPQQETAEHVAGLEQIVPDLALGEGGVLVLSQAPAAAQLELLNSRLSHPHFGWVVIVLGRVPVARWRFTARDDGWLSSGFLPDVRFGEQASVRRVDPR
ncbi:hypothetical protein [Myceligenerans xiligouense]|uniref:LysM domain-containing protein n=1 Tax=Myceligenerans xiligouense TaxID=253184 RepID=A0A3N4YL92_9MICO|nr:hypothetical protein [Myceligenerans xiligouense]RPF20867.1 hypothetical protein EDD34_1474 [Myceligenerans xiligouense]